MGLEHQIVVLAKLETDYGVDPTPTPAANAIMANNVTLPTPISEKLERLIVNDKLGKQPHKINIRGYTCSFDVEMKGHGTDAGVAPPEGCILQACAMKETVDGSIGCVEYTPTLTIAELKSCTLYIYVAGLLRHIMSGCVGNVSLTLTAGQIGLYHFEMTGLYVVPTDVALVSPTFPTHKPPIITSAAYSLGGYAGIINALELNSGNAVSERPSVNSATGGVAGYRVTNKAPTGAIDPEAVIEATEAFWADFLAGTEHSLSIDVGVSGHNYIQVTAPKYVYDELAWGARDGIRTYDIPFSLYDSSGNDFMELHYGPTS